MPEPAVGSPLWWLTRLDRERRRRLVAIRRWDDYHEGRHPLFFVTSKYREEFGQLFARFADNWMPLVVSAVEERLNVTGFRFPADLTPPTAPNGNGAAPSESFADTGDVSGATGDPLAWYIWQANELDVESIFAHTDTLALGTTHWLVDPTVRIGQKQVPQVTLEHPEQMIVATDPANRRNRRAALKVFPDEWTGRQLATVYLPDTAEYGPAAVWRYQRGPRGWEPRDGVDFATVNPLGVVPVVPLENRRRSLKDPTSDFDKVIALQDAVNKLMVDMIIASEFTAYPQRYAIGVEIPVDENGNDVEPFRVGLDRLFVAESPDSKFGAFPTTDLSNYARPIELCVQHIASQSSTPPHYLLGNMGTWPSGESLNASEAGLGFRAWRRQKVLEPKHEETLRLAFAAMGDPRQFVLDAETIWGDREKRSESEHVDATLKKLTVLPLEQIWEDLGYTPTQVRRFRELLRAEAAERNLRSPDPALTSSPLGDLGVPVDATV